MITMMSLTKAMTSTILMMMARLSLIDDLETYKILFCVFSYIMTEHIMFFIKDKILNRIPDNKILELLYDAKIRVPTDKELNSQDISSNKIKIDISKLDYK